MLNEAAKARLEMLNDALISSLETAMNVHVYQDNVGNDELQGELNGIYHYIIFETGGMRRPDNKKFTLLQDVLVRLYAEGIDDLDGAQIDMISILEKQGYYFVSSQKGSIQKGEQDAYVDGIEFAFTRSIKYGL
jgi:hypothetical protein